MSKELKKLVETIVAEELGAATMDPVFEPQGPVKLVKGSGDYFIAREFGIRMTPDLAAALQLHPTEIAQAEEDGGVLYGEWELVIDLDASYSRGSPGRLHGHPDTWHPPDPEDFEVGDWNVEGILRYGTRSTVVFTPEDSQRLKAMLGDLTEDEIDRLREQYIENMPEPDFEPDYGDY